MYENAIDGEHLPWLHRDSFSSLEILDRGSWGWRAKACLQPASFMNRMELELRLDREHNRWITTTLAGLGKGTQIVTHAVPLAEDRIKVIVDFYVPKLPRILHPLYARQFIATYSKLYDEDLWMMSTRQQELDRLRSGAPRVAVSELSLGSLETVRGSLPLVFEFQNRPYRLVEIDGVLLAHATTCPHMLGPLQNASLEDGQVQCPWHGYRFEVKTGQCTSGQRCRLAPAPAISVNEETGDVVARVDDSRKRQAGVG
jgi:nitrite reductase/ring-hydroxylating ferredoxin subunit